MTVERSPLSSAHLFAQRERRGSFVGRREDLATIDRAVSGSRLVTIVGPSGIGKTRLVAEYVAALTNEMVASSLPFAPASGFSATAIFCTELDEVTSVHGLVHALSEAIGVAQLHRERDVLLAAAHIGHALAARGRALVVLDAFEHLVEACASSVEAWLAAAPQATFLVTSREALNVASETRHELSPLPVPDDAQPFDGARAARREAIEHLCAQVRRHARDFAARDEEVVLLARIARQLDGNPLAIQLAARPIATLGLSVMIARLDNSVNALAHPSRGDRSAQSILRQALDASWELLRPEERAALARCSVFRGGFTLEAAEHVVDLSTFEHHPSIDETLHSLREKSLLQRDHCAHAARLSIFGTIRAYAAEKLDASGERATTEERHALYFARLATLESAPTSTATDALPTEPAPLTLERENLLVAAERLLARPSLSGALVTALGQVLLALEPLAITQGAQERLSSLVEAALARASDGSMARLLRSRLLVVSGKTHGARDHLERARTDLEGAAELAREHATSVGEEPSALEGRALSELSLVELRAGNHETAMETGKRALAIHLRTEDRRSVIVTTMRMGAISHDEGRLDAALVHYHDALQRSLSGSSLNAIIRHHLGTVYLDHGQSERALSYLTSALQIFDANCDGRGAAWTLASIGTAHHAIGDLEEATSYFRRCREVSEHLGERSISAYGAACLGAIHLELDRLDEAREALAAVLDGGGDRRRHRHLAYFRGCLGVVAAMHGERDEAKRHFAEATAAFPRATDPLLAATRVHAAHLDLLEAQLLDQSGESAAADATRKRVAELVDEMSRQMTRPDSASSCFELRFALRLLLHALRAARRRPNLARSAIGIHRITVHASGAWFRVDDEPGVTCEKRKTLSALLAKLAAEAVASAGVPVSLTTITDAVWPGEKIRPSSAKNRVAVLVTTLRGLGLREVLLNRNSGYFFDPSVAVEIEATTPAPEVEARNTPEPSA